MRIKMGSPALDPVEPLEEDLCLHVSWDSEEGWVFRLNEAPLEIEVMEAIFGPLEYVGDSVWRGGPQTVKIWSPASGDGLKFEPGLVPGVVGVSWLARPLGEVSVVEVRIAVARVYLQGGIL